MALSPTSDSNASEPVQLSLMLACYNEEPLIDESVEQILEVLDCCRWTYEVIFVDDCSRDSTREATGLRTYKFYWHSFDRYLMSRGYIRLVQWLLDVPLRDTETGFKFFRKEHVLPILDQIEDRHWFWDTEVMVRSLLRGLNIQEIPVLFLRRFDKQSGVRAVKDTIDYFGKLWRFRREVRRLRQEADFASIPRGRVQEGL
jgi:hypothetical protein